MPRYEVPIVYRGQSNYIVEAADAQEAERIARAKFNGGDQSDELGNEWESIERVGEITALTDQAGTAKQ